MLGDCSLFSCLFRINWLLVFINFDNLLEIGVAVGKSMAKEWFLAIHEWLHLVLRLILLWEWPICILRNNVTIFSSWGLSFSIIIWGTFLESWLSARRFYFSYFLGALNYLLVAVWVLQNLSQLLYRSLVAIVCSSIASWWFTGAPLFNGILSFVYQFNWSFVF